MRALVPSFVALLLAACGDAPPAPRAEPGPAAAPTPAVAQAPVKPHGRVFLAATETGLVPIACHEAHVPKFSFGAPCLALTPTGSEVKLESGAKTKVTGTAPAACGGAAAQPSAVDMAALVDAPAESLRGHATAPADAEFVEVVPPTTPAEALAAHPDLPSRLSAAVFADHPALGDASKLQLRQVAEIDLDGDRSPETLASVTLPGADEDSPPAFAAVYQIPKAAGERPIKLKGEPGTNLQYTVLGALDLDADGRPELWLNSYDDDGFAWSIEQVGGAQLKELGRWRCDA